MFAGSVSVFIRVTPTSISVAPNSPMPRAQVSTSVLMMGLSDRPGEFAKAMRVLADNAISVEYMYAFVSKDSGKASIIIRTDELERGIEVLKENGVTILTQEDIG